MSKIYNYVILAIFVAISGFCGYLLGENINFNNEKFIATDTGKYVASAKVVCLLDEGVSESDYKSSNTNISVTLADNLSVVFKYSTEIQELIPHGYEFIITPVNESNVVNFTVKGENPGLCAETVNVIRDKAPEVVEKYFSGGSLKSLGADAVIPTETLKIYEETSSVSTLLFSVIGIGVGALMAVTIVLSNKKFTTKGQIN